MAKLGPICLQGELLAAMQRLGTWSRIEEIACAADLSVVTTKRHVASMYAEGVIQRHPHKSGRRGRPAFLYMPVEVTA